MHIETDYLVIGTGATGLAFVDSLVSECDADIVLVDRRNEPGGHWCDTYPFVRLHTASAFYGVNSLPLGDDRIIESGRNQGFYEQASGAEVFSYLTQVVTDRLEPTDRVRLLAGHEHLGGDVSAERVRDLHSGAVVDIDVRRRVVDATYLEASIPATHTPAFTVAPEAAFVPVGGLPAAADAHSRYTVIGAGKTGVDACLWLLDHGIDPDRIRWIRPRDMWFTDRATMQPLDQVASIMSGIADDAEAAAHADDLTDLALRLEDCRRFLRLDPDTSPTMYRGTMISRAERDALQQVTDIVRLGRVRRIERNWVVLEGGEIPTGPDVLHVDCSAYGLRAAPAVPIFQPGRIVLQQARHNSPTFNAALLAFVEAHRDSDEDKNRLCPPNPYPRSMTDWGPMMRRTWMTERGWTSESDIASWVATSRLNLLQALPQHLHEADARAAVERFVGNVGPAIERIASL